MDTESIKLILELTVIPCIGFISALVVTIIGGWVTFQFSKSLEKYKQNIESQPQATAGEQKPNTVVTINGNTSNKFNDDEPFSNWITKVLIRGTIVILNLLALATGTIITFIVVRPFGIVFIYNRISELIQIQPFRQLYYEVTQFFSIELLSNLYLLGVSMMGGLLLMAFSSMIIDVVSWVFNIKPDQ
jgi:hypothetical protein